MRNVKTFSEGLKIVTQRINSQCLYSFQQDILCWVVFFLTDKNIKQVCLIHANAKVFVQY